MDHIYTEWIYCDHCGIPVSFRDDGIMVDVTPVDSFDSIVHDEIEHDCK